MTPYAAIALLAFVACVFASSFILVSDPRRLLNRLVLMSGYTGDALERYGVPPSSDQFIAKPFGPAELLERIATVLRRPDA